MSRYSCIPLLPLAPQPLVRPWPPPQSSSIYPSPTLTPLEAAGSSIRPNFWRLINIFFLQCRVVSPTLNPHPGGLGLRIYTPQRHGGPVIPPRHRVPILVASYDTHGLRFVLLRHGNTQLSCPQAEESHVIHNKNCSVKRGAPIATVGEAWAIHSSCRRG
jgi:hypothetical protein